MLLAPPAAADALVLIPGYINSTVSGVRPAVGTGGELTLVYYSTPTYGGGQGVFVQLERYSPPDHVRFGAGVQFNYKAIGFELGYGLRTGADDVASTHGLHIAPFVSAGFLSIAARFTAALVPADGWGNELATVVALKLPLTLTRKDFWTLDRPWDGAKDPF